MESTMNRSEIVEAILETSPELKKKDAEAVVNGVFETIKTALEKGKTVQVKGFGTFKLTERQARTGVNPKTGEKIQIAAKKAVTFKASSSLKEKIQ